MEGADPLKMTINCAPIMDDGNTVRGCLVTFDDLSLVEHMNRALLDSVAQLEVAKKQIEAHNAELKRIADVDQLTGALTRRAFLNQAQQQFRESAAHRRDVCCVMVDIDHFKSINDRYGHLVGDQAIQHVTKTIQAELCPADILCRYGGEEFCILLPEATIQKAYDLAEHIRMQIEAKCGPNVIPGDNVRITCSFGVASVEFGGNTLAEIIKQADQALYVAKNTGRNRTARYDQATNAKTAVRAVA
jgi:diguanylate cyclase (GGDEF)-like protein